MTLLDGEEALPRFLMVPRNSTLASWGTGPLGHVIPESALQLIPVTTRSHWRRAARAAPMGTADASTPRETLVENLRRVIMLSPELLR